eukprot:4208259-Prymnesium_polylepis.1
MAHSLYSGQGSAQGSGDISEFGPGSRSGPRLKAKGQGSRLRAQAQGSGSGPQGRAQGHG